MAELDGAARRVLAELPVALAVVDRGARVVFVNQPFTTLLGYTVDDLPTLDDWCRQACTGDPFCATSEEAWRAALHVVLESGLPVPPREHVVRARDGSERLLELSAGRVGHHLLAVFTDRTDRRAEAELRKQVAFTQAVIDNAAEGICVCRRTPTPPTQRFTVWNDRMTAITGFTVDQMNAAGWRCVFPDADDRAAAERRLERQWKGEELRGEEWTIQRLDGTPATVEVSSSALRFDDGAVHILLIVKDVTERRRAEVRQREFDHQLREAQKLESLGVLAGGIAHDFNNLLVAILGHAEAAIDDLPAGAAARHSVEEVRRAALRAAELTNQMLAYSGKGRFVVEPVDVNEMLLEIGRLLHTSISKKATMVFEFDPELPLVRADVTQLRQVALNLVTNASEAIGDREGRIVVRTERVAPGGRPPAGGTPLATAAVVLTVQDDGCGMDEETQARIFEPFFTTKFSGRGLGLAAVAGILRAHGGSIRVESVPQRGTRMSVLLPASDVRVVLPEVAAAPEPLSGSSPLVLVVDDEAAVRKVARLILERRGFRVEEAADGEEALAFMRERGGETDAVLLDMTMPRLDGRQTLEALRRIKPDVRVVLSSGYTEIALGDGVRAENVVSFVQKPFTFDTLAAHLQGAVRPAVRSET